MQDTDNNPEEGAPANEPHAGYGKREFRIFHSHEEQEQYELSEMARLSPQEILRQMRRLINIAYGMHGYDPAKLPDKHDIRIITPDSE